MPSSDFSQITIVSVTGMPDATSAAYALELSRRQMLGARALLCSPKAPANLAEGIEHKAIAPLNYHEYSWFMMFALWRVIETEYALIVQDDGWVLDANNWRDEYFDYDYVGPTTHVGRVDTAQGTRWLDHYTWSHEVNKPGTVVMPVLNGGFCLRSRRMLRALVDHPHIKVEIPPPDAVKGDPLQMSWSNFAPNEDVQLTTLLRPSLEAVGLKFAPIDACLRFGIEHAGHLNRGTDTMQLFGHHCRWRKLTSIDPPVVHYRCTRSRAANAFGEMAIVNMLERRGYRVEFVPEAGLSVSTVSRREMEKPRNPKSTRLLKTA